MSPEQRECQARRKFSSRLLLRKIHLPQEVVEAGVGQCVQVWHLPALFNLVGQRTG